MKSAFTFKKLIPILLKNVKLSIDEQRSQLISSHVGVKNVICCEICFQENTISYGRYSWFSRNSLWHEKQKSFLFILFSLIIYRNYFRHACVFGIQWHDNTYCIVF